MKRSLRALVLLLFTMSFVISCQSTIPTSADMDRFYEQATDIANRQIALLDTQLAKGEIDQLQRDQRAAAIRANIPKQAGDLAWARHELAESERRALGIPTGDSSVSVIAPQSGGGGESFYRPRGQVGSGFGNSSTYGGNSGLSQPSMRGETQGVLDTFGTNQTSDFGY